MALWGSFLIQTPGHTVLHIGDTAYGDGALFHAIRQRYGAPDLAILPIGAYEPKITGAPLLPASATPPSSAASPTDPATSPTV